MPRAKKYRVRVTLSMSEISNKRLRKMAKDTNCELSYIVDRAIDNYFFVTRLGEKLNEKLLAKIKESPEDISPDPVDLPPLL